MVTNFNYLLPDLRRNQRLDLTNKSTSAIIKKANKSAVKVVVHLNGKGSIGQTSKLAKYYIIS